MYRHYYNYWLKGDNFQLYMIRRVLNIHYKLDFLISLLFQYFKHHKMQDLMKKFPHLNYNFKLSLE